MNAIFVCFLCVLALCIGPGIDDTWANTLSTPSRNSSLTKKRVSQPVAVRSPYRQENNHRYSSHSYSKQRHSTQFNKRKKAKSSKNSQASQWFTIKAQTSEQTRKGLSEKNLWQNALAAPRKALGITRPRAKKQEEEEERSPIHIDYERESVRWSGMSQNDALRTDEDIPLTGEHHVRAYATVNDSDDVDFSIGPEIILKEQKQNLLLNTKTEMPRSQIGLGMQFKIDF